MKMLHGMKAEYKKRQDDVWPEILELIKKSGISDNSPVTIPLEEVFYLA